MLDRCKAPARWADPAEQAVLARWSGWGALPEVFDENDQRYQAERDELRSILRSEDAWDAARRTTLNAHYTSAEVVQAMWSAVEELGFTGGRVLEPGCGSGNFIGFAPDAAEMVGVELDPVTADVARHLYGARATVHTSAFEEFTGPEASFDLVVGNVPFASVTPFDPRHNRLGHALHNYFLIKSLLLTRPGGLVVALTSRYTLDARNPGARREMAELADLVGAIRLPAGAFSASSGTKVVVDLLVLRRRGPREAARQPAWVNTVPLDPADAGDESASPPDGPSAEVLVNEYLAKHPQFVLGRLAVGRGMYRERELTVESTGVLDLQLRDALGQLIERAGADGRSYEPAGPGPVPDRLPSTTSTDGAGFELRYAQEGSLVLGPDQTVGRLTGRSVAPYRPRHAKDGNELRRLIRLRDAARHVLTLQVADNAETQDLGVPQAALRDEYDAYVRLYGPINRFRMVRTGRRDPQTGEEQMRRDLPRMGGFRKLDPDWPLVAALEVFEDETQTARPAPIFTERVVAAPRPRLGADTAADALAICLDETGAVDLDRVAELLGMEPDRARTELGELVYDDPATGSLVPAAQYLSGNVRRRLDIARAAAAAARSGTGAGVGADRWQPNIAALERVLPRQLEPGEIAVQLGAPWVPPEDVEAFCKEVLEAEVIVERLVDIGRWTVAAPAGRRRSVMLTSVWGTERASAITLLDAALNQRLHTVYDTLQDGTRVRNLPETLAAREKQEALAARFSRWVWEDPGRAARLAATYNELFCSVVLTRHDGAHLTLPGLSATFTPRHHQRDAVARILTDGRALLAHAVGAGKTATMVMAAMELRRLGLASKPAVVVPNHMLEQFSREWIQLYPTARILIADAGQLDKRHRKEFVARCATGDWDGIVFTHGGFERIPLGRQLWSEYLGVELAAMRRALKASKGDKGLTVKKLEAAIAQTEASLRKLLDAGSKDDGVRFEETGIDYLMVDEAHAYKNRRLASSIDGASHPGSKRAQDMDAKLWALRRSHGSRTVVFSTATPVANSMAELWVMQSYLQPDVLAEANLGPFDSWAAVFGRTHTALELAPDGSSYRLKARFARFQNLPELLTMYRQVADVRTYDQLGLPTPEIAGGQAETVVVPPSDGLTEYVAMLAKRAEAIRNGMVPPKEDNMLAVTGDGRRAALDLRLVGWAPDPAGGKIAAAARRIAGIHHATRDNAYVDEQSQPTSRRGALQLVFCDVSTPASAGWNAYAELRDQLVRRGVPAEEIRFMQEAKDDDAKARLFATCRDGRVAVLVGSTETMGVGTNVQARAVALHHLDAPWRPADIEQREGRIVRQGNQNPSVEIVRYVTEGSFDIYMWQTLERKAAFIAQVSRGEVSAREVEELGEQVLSFAEVKALATGDPRIMEKAGIDAEVARLTRSEYAYLDDQQRLRQLVSACRHQAEVATKRADRFDQVLRKVVDTTGDQFAMTVDGTRHDARAYAGQHLIEIGAAQLANTPMDRSTSGVEVAQLAGLAVHVSTTRILADEITVSIPEAGFEQRYTATEWPTLDRSRLIQHLERAIRALPFRIEDLRDQATKALEEATRAEARLGRPWEHAARLRTLRHRQQELDEALIDTADIERQPSVPQRSVHDLAH